MVRSEDNYHDDRWSKGLPGDIIELIWTRLGAADSVRFGAVCSSWRCGANLVIAEKRCSTDKREPQCPWMVPSCQWNKELRLLSLEERREYKYTLTQLQGQAAAASSDGQGNLNNVNMICLGSVGGWLIMTASTAHRGNDFSGYTTFVLNPIGGRVLPLPPLEAASPDYARAAASLPPTSPGCIIVSFHEKEGTVHMCRPPFKEWKNLESCCSERPDSLFISVATREDGKLYAVAANGDVYYWDVLGQEMATRMKISLAQKSFFRDAFKKERRSTHIVMGMDGDVFLVQRSYYYLPPDGDVMYTATLQAWKLILDGSVPGYYQWEEVYSFGDEVILLLDQRGCKLVNKSNLPASMLKRTRGMHIWSADFAVWFTPSPL